jgi:hypothetical protein
MDTRTEGLISQLAENPKAAMLKAVKDMEEQGIRYYVGETLRLLVIQLLYALQGRLDGIPQSDLEWACRQLGVRKPDLGKITWTLKSKHAIGEAVDVLPMKEVKYRDANGVEKTRWDVDWNSQDMRIVACMEKAGFFWGGNWSPNPDRPHFEYRGK